MEGKIDLFDGHCDTILRCWRTQRRGERGSLRQNGGHIDLLRARASMENYCQFFAFFATPRMAGEGVSLTDVFEEQYRVFSRELEANRDLITLCRTAEEGEKANREGKIGAFLAVEGAELLDCDLTRLEDAYAGGVRAVNLTWNFENALSGSNVEGADKGLTKQGRAFVRRMQELGMIVDVSHLSDPGFWDVAQLAEECGKPFMAGHSNSRALCPHSRNLTDEQFLAIVKAGGVAGLNLYHEFLGENADVDTAVAHMEHWLALGGERSVAIGGDWDGCELCAGLTDITGLAALYEKLLRMNYGEDLIRAIFHDNMMRVVRDVCTM